VKEKYGKSIPGWVCKLFTDTCPICVGRLNKKKPKAGHSPILTHGFGARGQIDCIDLQSMPDGNFVYLLNYQDHGVKFMFSIPMTSKRSAAVAWALLEIFTTCNCWREIILQAHGFRDRMVVYRNGYLFRNVTCT
jgi:hypothetical protein